MMFPYFIMIKWKTRYVRRAGLVLVSSLLVAVGVIRLVRTSQFYYRLQVAEHIRRHNDEIVAQSMKEQMKILKESPPARHGDICENNWLVDSLPYKRLKALHSAIVYLENVTELMIEDVFEETHSRDPKLVCTMYEIEGKYRRPQVQRVWEGRHNGSDVTLVTQLSVEKLSMLELIADQWPGSVSASLHVNSTQLLQLCTLFNIHLTILQKPNLDIHIIHQRGVLYPVNLLRQIALDSVLTEYVFLVDADFIPDPGLYNSILYHITHNQIAPKQALVVPCFQFNWHPGKVFPQTKQELLRLWDINMVQPFVSCGFIPGVEATNYTRWRTSSSKYEVEEFTDGYEPYIVTRTSGLPAYDTKFLGRIRDKISHLMHVYALSYTLTVMPDNFIIHMPHSQDCNVPYTGCAFNYYKRFFEVLQQQYPDRLSSDSLQPDNRSVRPKVTPKS